MEKPDDDTPRKGDKWKPIPEAFFRMPIKRAYILPRAATDEELIRLTKPSTTDAA